MSPPLKVFLAFVVYAAVHSLWLTRGGRRAAEAAVGSRMFRGAFRAFYVAQALLLLGVFAGYAAALPDRELGRLEGGVAGLLWGLRFGALAFIGWCVARLGAGEFLGVSRLAAWRRGEVLPDDGVEAGPLVVSGPYRWVRHPMYAAGFVVLWATPRWTANGLAFAAAASLYLWLGAIHEERRLLATFEEAYRRYQEATPRFWPRRKDAGPA